MQPRAGFRGVDAPKECGVVSCGQYSITSRQPTKGGDTMKPTTGTLSISIILATAMPLPAPVAMITIPERFGVVDIIPTSQSGETYQDSEPSLGVGTGTNYGEMVLHAFTSASLNNYYYTCPSSGGPPWTNSGQV